MDWLFLGSWRKQAKDYPATTGQVTDFDLLNTRFYDFLYFTLHDKRFYVLRSGNGWRKLQGRKDDF
jgi:hypothetical protein